MTVSGRFRFWLRPRFWSAQTFRFHHTRCDVWIKIWVWWLPQHNVFRKSHLSYLQDNGWCVETQNSPTWFQRRDSRLPELAQTRLVLGGHTITATFKKHFRTLKYVPLYATITASWYDRPAWRVSVRTRSGTSVTKNLLRFPESPQVYRSNGLSQEWHISPDAFDISSAGTALQNKSLQYSKYTKCQEVRVTGMASTVSCVTSLLIWHLTKRYQNAKTTKSRNVDFSV